MATDISANIKVGGQARYEVVADEARVVRQVFDWVGRERLSIGEVCRRLMQAGELTRTGRTMWDRRVVWAMLKNPAYMGQAAFGKTRQGPLRPEIAFPGGASRCSRAAPPQIMTSRLKTGFALPYRL